MTNTTEEGALANYPHLASRIFDTPLMISRPKFETILSVLGPRMGLDVPQLAAAAGSAPQAHRNYQVLPSGAAVIPVVGSLVHRTTGIDAISGLMSYTEISKQFSTALESNDVTSIIFDMDSPGGEVNAIFDLSDQIFEARGEKPLIAIANEAMYSSAYCIGSACDSIYLGRTAGAGSIGVIAGHVDQSQLDSDMGLKVTTVFAGERKNDFNPHEELSDEALTILQAHVDETYDLFVETVARNRSLSTKAVRDTKAGFFIGKSAVNAKLADAVMSAGEAFATAANKTRKITMSTPKQPLAGARTIQFLSQSIAACIGAEKTREQVIDEIATGSGIEAAAVTTLLADGFAEAPTLDQLQAFVDATGASMDDILAAAKADGFEYETETAKPAESAETGKQAATEAPKVVSIDTARAEGESATIARAQAINEMCVIAGMPQLSGGMIARNLSVEAARRELFDKKAGGEESINSNIDAVTTGQPTVAASWDSAFKKINR